MLTDKSLEIIRTLAGKYSLKLVILFGGLAKGIYDEKSDMDIAILPQNTNEFIEKEKLSSLIYDFMEVEDIERREADIVLVTSENPILLYQIAKFGVPLYSENDETYQNFLSWARFTYEDNMRFITGLSETVKEKLRHI